MTTEKESGEFAEIWDVKWSIENVWKRRKAPDWSRASRDNRSRRNAGLSYDRHMQYFDQHLSKTRIRSKDYWFLIKFPLEKRNCIFCTISSFIACGIRGFFYCIEVLRKSPNGRESIKYLWNMTTIKNISHFLPSQCLEKKYQFQDVYQYPCIFFLIFLSLPY